MPPIPFEKLNHGNHPEKMSFFINNLKLGSDVGPRDNNKLFLNHRNLLPYKYVRCLY